MAGIYYVEDDVAECPMYLDGNIKISADIKARTFFQIWTMVRELYLIQRNPVDIVHH